MDAPSYIYSTVIVDYEVDPISGAPVTVDVSTITQLWPGDHVGFGQVSQDLRIMEVYLENRAPAGSDNAVLTVDSSEGGLPDAEMRLQAIVAPQTEGKVIFHEMIPSLFVVYAESDKGHVIPVRFKIRGIQRQE